MSKGSSVSRRQRELQPGVTLKRMLPRRNNRAYIEVEDGVESVSSLNQKLTGNRDGTARIPFRYKTIDAWKGTQA